MTTIILVYRPQPEARQYRLYRRRRDGKLGQAGQVVRGDIVVLHERDLISHKWRARQQFGDASQACHTANGIETVRTRVPISLAACGRSHHVESAMNFLDKMIY